jgi:hypothetical protein
MEVRSGAVRVVGRLLLRAFSAEHRPHQVPGGILEVLPAGPARLGIEKTNLNADLSGDIATPKPALHV